MSVERDFITIFHHHKAPSKGFNNQENNLPIKIALALIRQAEWKTKDLKGLNENNQITLWTSTVHKTRSKEKNEDGMDLSPIYKATPSLETSL